LLGVTIGVVMLIAAAPISAFYQQPDLFWVVCTLAFGPVLAGLENIGVVAFRKELQFRKEFLFQLGKKLIGFVVVVSLALLWRSYWALVVGILATKTAATALSFAVHPFRPRWSLREAGSLFGFSKWMLLNNVLAFLKERTTDFAIGRIGGTAPLGLYNISYEIANLPTSELSAPINRAMIPGYARIAGQHEQVSQVFLRSTQALALLALPAAGMLAALAPLMVPVVLGERWLSTVPLIQILAVNGAVLVFLSQTTGTLVALGHPQAVTRINSGYVLVLIPVIVWQVYANGAAGAAAALLAMSVVASPAYWLSLRAQVRVSLRQIAKVVVRPLLSSAAMVITLLLGSYALGSPSSAPAAAAWLVALVLLGGTVYCGSVWSLWAMAGRPDGAERWVLERLRERIPSRARR
jgi:O-antigen/teichoic acid export membrane protein